MKLIAVILTVLIFAALVLAAGAGNGDSNPLRDAVQGFTDNNATCAAQYAVTGDIGIVAHCLATGTPY